MKAGSMFILLSAVIGAVGCAPLQPLIVNDPVGPLQQYLHESGPNGSLTVYSDTGVAMPDPADYSPHSDYRLYSMDGRLLQSVQNRNAMNAREPVTLRLGPGKYKVIATAPRIGLVSVPVVIGEGRTTVIDLNGEVLPRSLAASERWVVLPNGRIIGSKAE